MLIIQFIIIMSDSQLKKVIKKYKEKFKYTKDDFLQFLTTRVELQQDKVQQFVDTIQEQLSDELEEADLMKLLNYISAFQAGADIKHIDEEDLQKYTRIKFQDKKKRQKNIQKIQKNELAQEKKWQKQTNEKLSNAKKNIKQSQQVETKISNQGNQKLLNSQKNEKYLQQVQIETNFSKNGQSNNMNLNIERIDDDEQQVQAYVRNNIRDKQEEQNQHKLERQKEERERKQKEKRERQLKQERETKQKEERERQLKQRRQLQENQRRRKQKLKQEQARKQSEKRQLARKKQQKQDQIRQQQLIKQQKKREQEIRQKKRLQAQRQQQERKEQLKRIEAQKQQLRKQKQRKQELRKQELRKQEQQKSRAEVEIKKKSSNTQPEKMKQAQKLKTIEQQRSDEISLSYSQTSNRKSSNHLQIIEDENVKELVNITQYDKMGQDFMNPVIKFKILYKEKFVTWRRYSEIQKLMLYLRSKYQGIVLPEMPPKEGIKGNLTYFWRSSVNQQFLDQRKQKLKSLLNRLLACQTVCKDQVLIQFLEKQDFELPNSNQSQSYLQTIFDIKNIVLNYNQIKDYGVAYYNYVSEHRNSQINTECSQHYLKAQNLVISINVLNEYRLAMNQNFEKRRQIMYDSKMKPKGPVKTDFDKILEQLQTQSYQLSMQYGRYLQLKSTQSWENELIKQKTSQGGQSLQKIKENHEKTVSRIKKTQQNLLCSIKKFTESCQKIFQSLTQKMKEWRKKAHP